MAVPSVPYARAISLGALLHIAAWSGAASAQPADLPLQPAQSSERPPGVAVLPAPTGSVYADKRGLVLYGMDMRVLLRAGPDPTIYCAQKTCGKLWEPLLAPAGSRANIRFPIGPNPNRGKPEPGFFDPQSAPDWTIIDGPSGPQWAYKGWHMVFTRRGSRRGSTEFDGAEGYIWNTLKFVPSPPDVKAPAGVQAKLIDNIYVLVDFQERILFAGKCSANCAQWLPFAGGLGNRGVGDWSISRDQETPHWLLKGKPVFVSADGEPGNVPAGGVALRP